MIQLYQEMVARIPQQDESVPYVKNGYRYQTRYEPGKEYAIYSRSKVEGRGVQPAAGRQPAGRGHDFYSLGALEVSRNNRWLAVAEDFLSRRQYKIQFLDLESGKWAADVLENTSGNLVWANDSKTVFYVRKHPQTLLPYQVYRHTLGTDPARISWSTRRRTTASTSASTPPPRKTSSSSPSPAPPPARRASSTPNVPDQTPRLFLPRQVDHEYSLDHYRGRFYVRSNKDGKNFGLYETRRARWIAGRR